MRIALLADFPVHRLPGCRHFPLGHHATWLAILAAEFEQHSHSLDLHWITNCKHVTAPLVIRHWNQTFHLLPRKKLSIEIITKFQLERRLIRRRLSSIAPDLVHAWGSEQGYTLAARDFNGPSLVSMQGILTAYCAAADMPIFTRIQAHHERRILQQVTRITVESPWGKDQLRGIAPNAEIDIVEYGVDPACFEVSRLPDASPLALFVGSATQLKGIDTLFQAFSDPRLRHVKLIVLGAVSPALRNLTLPPSVELCGHVSTDEVRAWMARAWCLVHPTRADTSPNCVKEARVIGLPVVTTPNGGQTQYVEHGQSGFIHPAGDCNALVEGVLALTESLEMNLRMGAHGQAKCRCALRPESTAARLLEIYQK